MNRLTYKEGNGNWGIVGMNASNQEEKMYDVASKLFAYEETGFSPKELEEVNRKLKFKELMLEINDKVLFDSTLLASYKAMLTAEILRTSKYDGLILTAKETASLFELLSFK